jgi:hypothetical protein
MLIIVGALKSNTLQRLANKTRLVEGRRNYGDQRRLFNECRNGISPSGGIWQAVQLVRASRRRGVYLGLR